MNEQGDSTIVTGSPVASGGGPRSGEVLAERYEVIEPIGGGPFTLDFRAFDQELEEEVLARVVHPALVPGDEANAVARRLSRVVGVGGKYLSALLDTYWEQPHLLLVEALPKGTTLREVVQTRMARGERIEVVEMLPVAARLAAALHAVPPPFRHGNVRAETIFIDPEDLKLSCPFLLGALPQPSLCAVLEADPRLRRVFAPEVMDGSAGDAADRFGVACVVYEGLTGRLPEAGAPAAEELGAVGEALAPLLDPDPSARPPTLDGLIAALASGAGLPVPEISAGAFRRPRRLSVRRKSEQGLPAVVGSPALPSSDTEPSSEQIAAGDTDPGPPSGEDPESTRRVVQRQATADGTQELSLDQIVEARRIAGAAPEGTQEIDASEILEERTAAAAPRRTKQTDPGLDPRLVRAALGVELEASGEREVPSAPPDRDRRRSSRPAPAAPGSRGAAKGPGPTPRRPRDPTLELGPDDLEMVEERARRLPSLDAPTPSQRAAAARRRKHATPAGVVRLPADIKPIPKARRDATPAPPRGAPPAMVLFDDSGQGGGRPPAGPPPRAVAPAPAPIVARPAPAPVPGPATPVDPWPGAEPLPSEPTAAAVSYERPAPRRSARWGRWLLLVAVVLAAIIIAGGVLVARERRSQAERERRLQERYHLLQQQSD